MSRRFLSLATLAGLAFGALFHLFGWAEAGSLVWSLSAAIALVPLTWSVARTLRHRDVGVDAIALVAIAAALALGQYLAAAVVALMMAGGNALEEFAAGHARRELTQLLARMPRIAHRRRDSTIEEIPVGAIVPGDRIVVRAGEVLPVDGTLVGTNAVLDEAALTGESLPVVLHIGEEVRSGSANAGHAFEICATRSAAESAYAGIVQLVRRAETDRPPFVRIADRYAAIFLPISLALAFGAWAWSGSAVRFLAVMVVATPCPLILAAPIALISGVSRAARNGVIVKGGSVIERLGQARTVLLDKTGTVTLGVPGVERVVSLDGLGSDQLLGLAASVDQFSAHVLGEALVREAVRRGLSLAVAQDVAEAPGEGIAGVVAGRHVAVGSRGWLRRRGFDCEGEAVARLDHSLEPGHARILVGVDDHVVGAIVMSDDVRVDARDLVDRLRALDVRHVALVTGDQPAVADVVGAAIGVDRVYSEETPSGKLEVVRALRNTPELQPVVMVGDGVNDAPALALADVGIALGSAGATVSSETADAVIVVDRIDRIVAAIQVGRRSLRIARQSVIAGMGLSLVAMGFAFAGAIAPVFGALLQEVIDVAVIANALRALRG